MNSSDASISFQAAQSLLQLTQILSSKPNSGGIRAVAGVASSWGPLAVAALLQLWDRQLSFAGHAQLMVVLTEHLPCLQVFDILQRLHLGSLTINRCKLTCSFLQQPHPCSKCHMPHQVWLCNVAGSFDCKRCSVSQNLVYLMVCHCVFGACQEHVQGLQKTMSPPEHDISPCRFLHNWPW